MLHRKFFENSGSVIAILVLFVQLLRKILFKFFTPNFESFTKYDAFCSHISINMFARRKDFCYRRGSKLWKNCIHQKHS